ncbi:hypothetical protein HBI64_155590 [Parastagonospora nodorum]|nr:hypothetical protein HBH47_218010 [Parastagonospora nodorum]KAH4181381.1 hypothetical protein HBH42_237880 [Parastagonospora nodorum]KAH5251296.1 hypothetical protein HBI72_153020 [Parastagonospora nodorum]KAH6038207.1 hypothetical protein HBI54_174750 [Parastagonospora nodorum]KAH6122821.1 hypothetical protein HBI64_155590 [Parastagonospora nodorum]
MHDSLDYSGVFGKIEEETVPMGLTHNYPFTFLEREKLLRYLYENLKNKSKIRLGNRITNVDHNSEEVIVLCENGTAVSGDILVGCDGVNSTVRQALWRFATSQDPTAFDIKEKTMLMAEYQCLFGISEASDILKGGEVHINYDQGSSFLTICGKDKVFWFVFKKLDKVYTVPNIPRYTKHDAEVYASSFEDAPICDGLEFEELWRTRKTFTLVATEEAQMRRWTWGRIACAGDCVHKMTPNMGAGGNAAVESAAAIANEIKKMVDASEKGKPSFDAIKYHLSKYQSSREQRTTAIVNASNDLTRTQALTTWKDRLVALWVLPLSMDLLADISCDTIIGAVRLDYLPVPERSLRGTMPFNPSQGSGMQESKLLRALKALPFLGITAAAVYLMVGTALPPMRTHIVQVLEHGVENRFGQSGFVQPMRNFYGIEAIDSKIRGLAACFASFQFVDPIANWQGFSFLMDAGIVYAILLIESARRANIMTFASFLVVLGLGMQLIGMAVLLPIYFFIFYVQSPIENFRARDMRLTDMSYTASVLPAMILAHYVPSFSSTLNFIEPQTRHMWNWIWQLFPLYISILQFVLKKTVMPDTVHKDKLDQTERDIPTITYTIGSLCALASTVWWYTLYSAPYSLKTIFIPNLAPGQTGEEYIRMFLQVDELCVMAACFLWLLYLYGDLKKVDMMADSWISILLKGVASLVALGPGVTVGFGWLYRERLLATKWHKDALVPGKAN